MAFHWEIEAAEETSKALKREYLQKFGWRETCNTPGSFWVWKRDFAGEDAARHARWKERGPGPMGWSSEPQPHGVITASLDLAVSMTASFLDDETDEPDEDDLTGADVSAVSTERSDG